jgi:peptidoglycan/LPS O-acetylase OafA/YrhL
VAVVLVVAYHVGLLRGGFVGVDVFFVVSGYVIAQVLSRELATTGHVSLGRFYLRRVRRLLPALGLMLAVTTAASVFLLPIDAQEVAARTAGSAALLNANHYLMRVGGGGGYFGFDADANPFLHTWSLSVEEQFYLLFPIVVALAWRRADRRQHRLCSPTTATLGLLAALSFTLGVWFTLWPVTLPVVGSVSGYYPAAARAWEFVLGAALAIAPGWRRIVRPSVRAVGLVGSLIAIGVSALAFSGSTAFPGFAALLPVGGTLVFLACGDGAPESVVSKVVASRPLRTVGDLSYSWYLWHWPAIVFAHALWPNTVWTRPVAAIVSLLPAWLSLRLVENPFRYADRMSPLRTGFLGACCVLAPVTAAAGLVAVNEYVESGPAKPFAHHVDHTAGCEGNVPEAGSEGPCLWPVANPRGTALLLGDSNAGQYSEGFIAAANSLDLDAVVAVKSSCLISDPRSWLVGVDDTGCQSFVRSVMAYVRSVRPTRVVLASSPLYLAGESDVRKPGDEPADGSAELMRSETYRRGLELLAEELREVDVPLTVLLPIPVLDQDWTPMKRPWLKLSRDDLASRSLVDRAAAERIRRPMADAQRSLASRGVLETADFFDRLCPGASCGAFDEMSGRWLYRDFVHISVEASTSLEPEFMSILSAAGSP